jgi:hypothetical protein
MIHIQFTSVIQLLLLLLLQSIIYMRVKKNWKIFKVNKIKTIDDFPSHFPTNTILNGKKRN